MRFQVPQFIEIEDKVFGPLTIKQFIYLAGAGGIILILYFTLPLFVTILIGLPVAGFGAALAFYKVNNRPFIYLVEAAVRYMTNSKLYIWKRQPKEQRQKKEAADTTTQQATPRVPSVSESKLKDLAWSLDIKERGGGTE